MDDQKMIQVTTQSLNADNDGIVIIIDPLENNILTLLEELKTILNNEQLTTLNVLSICISLMQIIEKTPTITGQQRKEVVLNVFKRYLESVGGDRSRLTLLPTFIDMAVKLDKKQVHISEVTVEETGNCLMKICMAGCMAFADNQKSAVKK